MTNERNLLRVVLEDAELVRYEHGGARLYVDGDHRELIADFYGDGEWREFFMDLVKDAAKRQSAAEPGDDWRPIETAPKDGTVIDLCCLNWEGKQERWCNARWTGDQREGWMGPWSDGCDCGLPDHRLKPTHWMLPPAFPVNRSENS